MHVIPGPAPVLVVGAGAYGLTIALELERRGHPVVVVGEPFALWFQHALSDVELRSDLRTSELWTRDRRYDLRAFLRRELGPSEARRLQSQRLPVRVFRSYLQWILDDLPLDLRRGRVAWLGAEGQGFQARMDPGGTLQARAVVLATGPGAHRHLPDSLAALGPDLVLHGWEAGRIERLDGQRILVVGSGQSAGETIAVVKARNEVTWLRRSEPTWHADPIHLPRPIFHAALRLSRTFAWMPRPVRRAVGSCFVGTTMTPDLRPVVEAQDVHRVRGDAALVGLVRRGDQVWSEALGGAYDKVVACTGYRPSVAGYGFLDDGLRTRLATDAGLPVLDRRFGTSIPRLFAVGAVAEARHGPAQRFLIGARNAAVAVSAALDAGA